MRSSRIDSDMYLDVVEEGQYITYHRIMILAVTRHSIRKFFASLNNIVLTIFVFYVYGIYGWE